jgi:hypothetical protein
MNPETSHTKMNIYGYLERKTSSGKQWCYRNWWLIKNNGKGTQGVLSLPRCIPLPKEYVGRKVRLRIEFMDEDRKETTMEERRQSVTHKMVDGRPLCKSKEEDISKIIISAYWEHVTCQRCLKMRRNDEYG